jgi:hypothetical protein
MTYTFKLSRRLARLRHIPVLLLPILVACAAGEPTGITSPTDTPQNSPVAAATSLTDTVADSTSAPAGPFTSVTAVRVTGTSARLSWQTSLLGVTQFEVQKAASKTTLTWGTYNYPTGTTRSETVSLALATSPYCFRLRATKPVLSDWSQVVCVGNTTSITLTPATASLGSGTTQQFSVSGKLSDGTITSSVTPTYTATGGTISATGLYTAGSTAGTFRVIATAQGKADTSAITIAATAPTGLLKWSADFESGAYPSGTTYEQCQAGRIAVYSNTSKPAGAPNALAGTHFSGHTLLDTDVSPCTPTSNPRTSAYKQAIFHPGDEVWESFSLYLPAGFPSFPYYLMFQEDYGAPFNSPPPNGVWMQNYDGTGNRFYITGNYDGATKTNVHVWSAPATPGVWHTWLVHKRFATDKSGWLEVWFDGQQVTFSNGSTRLTNQQTMLTGATSANFSLMHYRHAGMFPVSSYPNGLTIYFDEARVGTSRSAVELQSTLFASIP